MLPPEASCIADTVMGAPVVRSVGMMIGALAGIGRSVAVATPPTLIKAAVEHHMRTDPAYEGTVVLPAVPV